MYLFCSTHLTNISNSSPENLDDATKVHLKDLLDSLIPTLFDKIDNLSEEAYSNIADSTSYLTLKITTKNPNEAVPKIAWDIFSQLARDTIKSYELLSESDERKLYRLAGVLFPNVYWRWWPCILSFIFWSEGPVPETKEQIKTHIESIIEQGPLFDGEPNYLRFDNKSNTKQCQQETIELAQKLAPNPEWFKKDLLSEYIGILNNVVPQDGRQERIRDQLLEIFKQMR